MARIRIELPDFFSFQCRIPVRITDINYGGHAGNDSILSIIHEARMQYLRELGYTELEFAGKGLIMADAGIEFKQELFYGETIIASVTATSVSRIGFDLVYKMVKETESGMITVALAKTGMVCFDYDLKKIAALPDDARQKLTQ